MLRTPHPPQAVPSTFAKQTRQSLATCSPTGEGFCKPSILATDKSAICNRSDIGQSRTPVPTIQKGFSIEILAFIFIFLGSSRTSTPTVRYKSLFRRWTNVQFVTVTTSDDQWSPLQMRYMSMLSATDQTKIYISLFTIKIKRNPWQPAVHGFLHRY